MLMVQAFFSFLFYERSKCWLERKKQRRKKQKRRERKEKFSRKERIFSKKNCPRGRSISKIFNYAKETVQVFTFRN